MIKIIGENILTILTVVGQILIVLGFITLFYKKENPIKQAFERHGFKLAFIITLAALFGSLFYSDILGYEPCKFCWYQRIFMYPQALILGLALWRKDWDVSFYCLVMSILGGLLAFNHYILQISGTSLIPCSAVGYSVACSKVFTLKLGYITIPLMAMTAFALITIALIHFRRGNNAPAN